MSMVQIRTGLQVRASMVASVEVDGAGDRVLVHMQDGREHAIGANSRCSAEGIADRINRDLALAERATRADSLVTK